MNRIAVISSWAWIKVANNYGALLQYYALQQYLTRKNNYVFGLNGNFIKDGKELDWIMSSCCFVTHLSIYLHIDVIVHS